MVFANSYGPANENETSDPVRRLFAELVAIEPGTVGFPRSVDVGSGKEAVRLAPAGPFCIGKYEVPQDLYQFAMGNNPSRWRGPRNAVEMVDYADAARFCARLTALARERKLIGDDFEVRLPTEVEWEYACRAGHVTAYCFGDDPAKLGDYAWYMANAAGNDPPVGAKKPNAWDLFDMHGYLWEWCQSEEGAGTEPGTTTGPVRGGAWTAPADQCRSSARRLVPRSTKAPDVGLRIVVAPITKSRK